MGDDLAIVMPPASIPVPVPPPVVPVKTPPMDIPSNVYMPPHHTPPATYGQVCDLQRTQNACIAMSILPAPHGKMCAWDSRRQKCTAVQEADSVKFT